MYTQSEYTWILDRTTDWHNGICLFPQLYQLLYYAELVKGLICQDSCVQNLQTGYGKVNKEWVWAFKISYMLHTIYLAVYNTVNKLYPTTMINYVFNLKQYPKSNHFKIHKSLTFMYSTSIHMLLKENSCFLFLIVTIFFPFLRICLEDLQWKKTLKKILFLRKNWLHL